MKARIVALAALAFAALAGPLAAQENWPERPITLVIPYAAGGGADFVARLLADGISEELGESVVVESRPGGGGVIGAQYVAQSAPDGYTVMLSPAAPLVNAPLLRDNVPYDPQADLAPLSKLVVSPIMVLVNGEVPAQNVAELVDMAKASPGEVAVGNSGAGSTQQLLSLMFQGSTGTELNMISYTGSGEIVPDLLAGRLNMMLDFPAAYAENGEVRILATLSDKRLPLFPDVPTMAEEGEREELSGLVDKYDLKQ
jgi:tripartite-type tricarboxylate transporter receptor subunit TctC